MKKICLVFGFILCVYLSVAQQKKILFVGNSYTAGNNLAQLTNSIAASTGNAFIYETHTPGGQRFLHHAVNTTLDTKINAQDWDFVTLQGQSVEVALTGPVFNTEVAPYAAQLVNKIRTNNACTQPIFFRTWGRENGFTDCQEFPWICTYETMDDALAQNYQILAEQNNALVSPVGAVWRNLRTHFPNLELYTSDGSHPSPTGSYAAALTFYTLFFNSDPTAVTYNYTLSNTDANTIKNVVQQVVFNALSTYDFTAYFNETITNNTVDFSYNNLTADSYLWDFGDGNTSTQQNPTHTYNSVGNYQVTLTTTHCGRTNVFTKPIAINALSVLEVAIKTLALYPNPTQGIIHFKNIEDYDANIQIYNLRGQAVKTFKNNGEAVSISDLENGVYFIKVSIGKISEIKKIIKH